MNRSQTIDKMMKEYRIKVQTKLIKKVDSIKFQTTKQVQSFLPVKDMFQTKQMF